jgi:hypothetical protein
VDSAQSACIVPRSEIYDFMVIKKKTLVKQKYKF